MPDHHHDHDHTPTIFHATSPTCWWSWGYEPVLNRLRLVYGDQIRIQLLYQPVYEDVEDYFANYELSEPDLVAWAKESAEEMGVPMFTAYTKTGMPKTAVPPVLAVMAAARQGAGAGERIARVLLRRMVAGGEDVSKDAAVLAAAKEAALDVAQFQKDWADQDGLMEDLQNQGEGAEFPHVPLAFYNMVISDGHRHVVLEHAFDAAAAEDAIDWLAGGKLRKTQPADVAAYLRAHGAAPKEEIAKVFAWPVAEAEKRLGDLEKEGKAKPVKVGDLQFWGPA